jgi:hypothetical protein
VRPRDLEVWFGLNPRQPPRHSGFVGAVRFDGSDQLHVARFQFEHGAARPGETVHAIVWFRDRDAALPSARPTVRFDVLEGATVIATGEVLAR